MGIFFFFWWGCFFGRVSLISKISNIFLEKNPQVSGPTQPKPVLIKGQLCFSHIWFLIVGTQVFIALLASDNPCAGLSVNRQICALFIINIDNDFPCSAFRDLFSSLFSMRTPGN